jgi:hypothetical protein
MKAYERIKIVFVKKRGSIMGRFKLLILTLFIFSVAMVDPATSGITYDGNRLIEAKNSQAMKDAPKVNTTQAAKLQTNYSKLPLSFEPNQGQTDERVKFISRGDGYALFLTPTKVVFHLTRIKDQPENTKFGKLEKIGESLIRVQFGNSNPKPDIRGLDLLKGKSNYLIGKNPKKWKTNIPQYAKVRYEQIYPGIDLVYYGKNQQLEFDLVISPEANPKAIRIRFAGIKKLSLDDSGSLILHAYDGELKMNAPHIYQEINGKRQEITGGYVLKREKEVGFQVAAYDKAKPLVIDPVLCFSTYFGGSSGYSYYAYGVDEANDIAVDGAGYIYITGTTSSEDFPVTSGAFDTVCALDSTTPCSESISWYPNPSLSHWRDAFVAKIDPNVPEIIYSTYLGGFEDDSGNGITVDSSGNVYVTGGTISPDFPTTPTAYQTSKSYDACQLTGEDHQYCSDIFVTKINADGSGILYSSFFGGITYTNESGSDIAIDTAGNAYVTGSAESQAFVLKVNPNASGNNSLVYWKLFGYQAAGASIAVDSLGQAHVAGTVSGNIPTTSGAYDTTCGNNGDCDHPWGSEYRSDAFVMKLVANPANPLFLGFEPGDLIYSTYLGGGYGDRAFGIALSPDEEAIVTGETNSPDFPNVNDLEQPFNNCNLPSSNQCRVCDPSAYCYDAFVTKLNSTGTQVAFSTYLGGTGNDRGNSIFVTGRRFWIAPNIYSFSGRDKIYVTGSTETNDFPSVNAFQNAHAGPCDSAGSCYKDAFVTQIERYHERNLSGGWGDFINGEFIFSSFLGGSHPVYFGTTWPDDEGTGIAVDGSGNIYVAGWTYSGVFPTVNPIQANRAGTCDAFVVKIGEPVTNWMGDINKDGVVDISDVILDLRIVLGLDPPKPCSDINGDGIDDISDVILKLRMALKLDPLKPCTE